MIILDPTAISDVTHSRASTGTYVDAAGAEQTAAADVLRFSYDPSDLTAGARALIEPEAANYATYSNELDNAVWSKLNLGTGSIPIVTPNYTTGPDGTMTADRLVCVRVDDTANDYSVIGRNVTGPIGDYTIGIWIKSNTGANQNVLVYGSERGQEMVVTPEWRRFPLADTSTSTNLTVVFGTRGGSGFFYTGGDSSIDISVGGIQVEAGQTMTSFIPTVGSTVTRAADIVGTTGTVLGSNVPETDAPVRSATAVYAIGDQVIESHSIYQSKIGTRSAVTMTIAAPAVVTWTAHGLPADTPISFATTGVLPTGLVAGTTYYVKSPNTNDFNVSATPGGAAINSTGSQSGVHTATAGQNFNRAVSDLTYWQLIGATNQRKMVDQYNNTQTTNAEVIIMTFTPRQISQGVYLGGLDADTVSVVVEDATAGIVHSATESLVISRSESSFFNWCFRRIRRKTYFFTGALPVYFDARITITIRRPGGTAKCGMCVVGPLIDIGMSQYGLSTEIKDYSSSIFAFDGTSSTVVRGYAKLMSVDLMIANDQIDYVQEQLADFRQKPVVFVGATMYGSAIVFGKYSSFKNVITYPDYSIMALSTQGTV